MGDDEAAEREEQVNCEIAPRHDRPDQRDAMEQYDPYRGNTSDSVQRRIFATAFLT